MKSNNKLRNDLYDHDGGKNARHFCGYCHIWEKDFIPVWGVFYNTRGHILEVDHKDNNKQNDSQDNLVLACALCNCAKSNKLTYDEFKKVGEVIRQIYQAKAKRLNIKLTIDPNSK